MEIKHVGHRGTSLDPTGDALALLPRFFASQPAEAPVTPVLLWGHLKDQGFYFMRPMSDGRLKRLIDTDAEVPVWGTYFASVVLRHALARGLITGEASADTYRAKG